MAISFVGSGTLNYTAAATFNFSSLLDSSGLTPTVQQDDIVIVNQQTNTSGSATGTLPTGYTETFAQVAVASGQLHGGYKVMGVTPDTGVTFVAPGGAIPTGSATIHVFRGVDTSNPLDVASTTASSAANGVPDPPSNTPSTAGAWVMAVGCNGDGSTNSGTVTNPAGFSTTTNHFQQIRNNRTVDTAIGTGLLTTWASGAVDPGTMGGTTSTAVRWAAATIVLKPNLGATVIPSGANHAHSSTSPTVSAKSPISPAAGSHADTASSPALAAKSTVAPANAADAHTATSPSVGAISPIVPASASHTHAVTSPTITVAFPVAPADCVHAHSVTSPNVSPIISPSNSLHDHAATSPTITARFSVAPDNASHAHMASESAVFIVILPANASPERRREVPVMIRGSAVPPIDRHGIVEEIERSLTAPVIVRASSVPVV